MADDEETKTLLENHRKRTVYLYRHLINHLFNIYLLIVDLLLECDVDSATSSTASESSTPPAATSTPELTDAPRACSSCNQPSSWLAARLVREGYDDSTVKYCEYRILFQEGFVSETGFAECPTSEFSREYLTRIGLPGLGLQRYLTKLHNELHTEYMRKTIPQSTSGAGATSGCNSRKRYRTSDEENENGVNND